MAKQKKPAKAEVVNASTDPNQKFFVFEWEEAWPADDDPCVMLKSRYRVYLLNPGEWFRGFGGSRHGLSVMKTASIVVRENHYSGQMKDTEYDLNNGSVWRWLVRRLINAGRVQALPLLEAAVRHVREDAPLSRQVLQTTCSAFEMLHATLGDEALAAEAEALNASQVQA